MAVIKLPGLGSPVALDSIIRVEGQGNYSWVYFTHQPRYLLATTLKRVETQLPGFIRVHKSALINPSYVTKLTLKNPHSVCLWMSDGAKLLVARQRLEGVRHQLRPSTE